MAAGDLTSVERVKGYLPNVKTADWDALLGRLITAASAWIKNYLNRDIAEDDYTDVLDGSGSAKIMVRQYPVTEVSAYSINGIAQDASKLVLRGALVTRTDGGIFAKGPANIVITYKAGYATIPSDLEQSCVELVCWRFRERERLGLASKSLQTGGEVESYQTKDVPEDVKTNLGNWKKVVPA